VLRLAADSIAEGCRAVRLEGDAVASGVQTLGVPVLGLRKRTYPGSDVYITPTAREVAEMLDAGCQAVALDATSRPRPGGESLAALVSQVAEAGRCAVGDCDSIHSALDAEQAGCAMLTTALAGYTPARAPTDGPDWALLHQMVEACSVPVLLEGRVRGPEDCRRAIGMGAAGVVVGTALNDVRRLTRAAARASTPPGPCGAADIGGTWTRYAAVGEGGGLGEVVRTPTPATFAARLDWIASRAGGVAVLGVSAGGTVDPATGTVVESLATIGDNLGRRYALPGVAVRALNDGLASAWAHGRRPEWRGARVLTVALGTGLGAGLVCDGRLDSGPFGAYPRLNDALARDGRRFEDALCSDRPSLGALAELAGLCRALFRPEVVVLCGARGLLPELLTAWPGAVPSPYGADAGLYGAAALAFDPPPGVFPA
jgi:putative N-acetylmannosamine-6-phosphate epimerase